MFREKKMAVPYPQLLDGLGAQLRQLVLELEREGLKPAIMADIVKVLSLLGAIQQLMVHMYNLNVTNYEQVLMPKIVKMEKDLEEFKTRVAGYSERLNKLEEKEGGK